MIARPDPFSMMFGISYPLLLLSECDAAFSLPPVKKSVESIIRLPCSINAWTTCVIARPDTNFVMVYDLYQLKIGCRKDLGTNLLALGADIAGALIPGVTGLGAVVWAEKAAGKIT